MRRFYSETDRRLLGKVAQLSLSVVRYFDTGEVEIGVDQVGANVLTLGAVLQRARVFISLCEKALPGRPWTYGIQPDVNVLSDEPFAFSGASQRTDSLVRVVACKT